MVTRSRRLLLPLVAVLLLAGGCGLFSGGTPAQPPLERTTLRIGVGNAIDTAPLRLAVADGRFNRAGLKIDLVEQGTGDGLAKLASGDLDIAFASDVSMFRAAAGGTALQLQGEAYTAGSGTMGLVTLANSPYTDPGAKKQPTIAVDMLDDLGTLAARSVLGTAGVDPAKITFYQCAYDQMTNALNDGDADAAWMVEPYITKAEKELGAQVLADGARGATQDFPVSAYASGRVFAQANPRTLALFRQVLGDAQQYAGDPASLIALGTYPTSLNAIRLQRVADLMHNAGALADRLDVQSLLPPSNTSY